MPAGDVPHDCIGTRFAKLKVNVGAVLMLHDFQFELSDKRLSDRKWNAIKEFVYRLREMKFKFPPRKVVSNLLQLSDTRWAHTIHSVLDMHQNELQLDLESVDIQLENVAANGFMTRSVNGVQSHSNRCMYAYLIWWAEFVCLEQYFK